MLATPPKPLLSQADQLALTLDAPRKFPSLPPFIKRIFRAFSGCLDGFWHPPLRFYFPRFSRPLPACVVRPCEERDFSACEEIYRLNESAHFPPGIYDVFVTWLRGPNSLILVCEKEGQIRAFGGIGIYRNPAHNIAQLAYGMVHPACQRQGYGTVLLLARLALLPTAVVRSVTLCPVKNSISFYRRFGFIFIETVHMGPADEIDVHLANLYEEERRGCRALLAQASISLPDVPIPEVDYPSKS